MRVVAMLFLCVLGACDGGGGDSDVDPVTDADGDGWDDVDDCAPADATVHPEADETCDGVDQDCDGEIDEDPIDGQDTWPDVDLDGYGDDNAAEVHCDLPAGHVETGGDCDDGDADVHPEAPEVCNEIDDDCDGAIDDDDPEVDRPTWYLDADGDGYGTTDSAVEACVAPATGVELRGDCQDDDATVHPGALERCNDLDDDCNAATTDEGTLSVGSKGYVDIQQALNGASAGAVVTICDGTFEGGLAITRNVTLQSLHGPEVTVLQGKGSPILSVRGGVNLTVVGLTFSGGVGASGTAGTGGAIDASLYDGGDVTLHNCVIADNTGRAGGVRMGTSTLSVDTCTFTDNVASGAGGAIASEGPVSIVDSTFTGNTASGDGGAIWVEDTGSLTITTSEISLGTAANGAGIAAAGPVEITDCDIVDNTAATAGGGLYVEGGLDLAGATEISGNIAKEGGGVYVESCDVTMADTVVLDSNEAQSTGNGGGVFVHASNAGAATWTGGNITNNTSDSLGGGVFVRVDEATGGSAWLEGMYAEGNDGTWSGGGFWLAGPNVEVYQCTAYDNVSTYGGGMSVNETTEIVLDQVVITDNVVSQGGGAFDVYLGLGTIIDSTVESNQAQHGGAVYIPADAWLSSDNTDWGEDETDNGPDDIYFEDSGESWDFGSAETFYCDGDTTSCD